MAYQGKFSPEGRKARLENRETPAAAAPRREPASPKQTASAAPRQTSLAQTSPNVSRQAAPPQKAQPSAPRKSRKRKSGSRTGTIIFYTIYVIIIVFALIAMFLLNRWLVGYLENYEAAQPTTKCEEVFQQYFAEPDWAELYRMAGVSDTQYESSDAFVSYMENKVSGQISYVETSAGLSGGHKYLLKNGDLVLGYFTMVDAAPEGAELPDWKFGEVVLNYAYTESVTVQKMAGQTVYVNGVALTDDHTIQIGTTLADNYLPAGVQGPQIHTQYLDGLMQEPVITATDNAGNPMDVSYNAEKDLYVVQSEVNTMDAELETRAIGAAKTYSLLMIEKASRNELAKYFDTSSQSYKTIISIDPWMQEWFFRSYEFANESVTGYYRYTDDLFSVHVKLSMFVTRTDDTEKEYAVDHTFFFKNQKGTWKCVNMINVDVSQQIARVRLTFKSDDTIVSTNFYDNDVTTLTVPMLTAPEGHSFTGWVREDLDESGNKTLTLVFTPDEDGNVTLPSNSELVPMTLYPLFEAITNSDGGAE